MGQPSLFMLLLSILSGEGVSRKMRTYERPTLRRAGRFNKKTNGVPVGPNKEWIQPWWP